MARRNRKTNRSGTRTVEPPNPLLERLKEVASQVGLEVREERLTREVGYSVRSGVCRFQDQEVLLLDRNAAAAERIEVLCSILSDRDLDSVFLEPELRRTIGGRALDVDLGADEEGLAATPA